MAERTSIHFRKRTLRVLLFLVLITGLAYVIYTGNERFAVLATIWKNFHEAERYPWLILSFLLMPVNWWLEAVKWQRVVKPVTTISILDALSGVLSGVSFGLFTPHGIGDYVGRLLQLESQERLRTIGAVFISRISQFMITLLFGTIAFFHFITHTDYKYFQPEWLWSILFIAANLFMLFGFYEHAVIVRWLKKIPLLNRLYPYFEILQHYSLQETLILLGIAALRYIVFVLQFVALFLFFGVDYSWELMFAGVGMVFLAKSVIPTFFEIGVRELAVVVVFIAYTGIHDFRVEAALYASMLLWIMNIIIPAIAGAGMIFRTKWMEEDL